MEKENVLTAIAIKKDDPNKKHTPGAD